MSKISKADARTKAYEVTQRYMQPYNVVVFSSTAGKAKYAVFRCIRECWEDSFGFADITSCKRCPSFDHMASQFNHNSPHTRSFLSENFKEEK